MIEAIRRALFGSAPSPSPSPAEAGSADHELQVAACALLLELAHADDEFSEAERRNIEEALARHFDLGIEAARDLMAQAEDRRGQAIDLHQFTSVIAKHYDEGQRMVLAEVLWRIVYADGQLSSHEAYLMRKLAYLLELRPGYLAEARKRAAPEGPGPV